MSNETDLFANFERMGEAAVRLHVENAGFNQSVQATAIKWLANKDQESERLKESSQAEQIEIARSAKDAASAAASAAERAATEAERANKRATIALIIAAISIVATIVGIWLVHRDSMRASSIFGPQVRLHVPAFSLLTLTFDAGRFFDFKAGFSLIRCFGPLLTAASTACSNRAQPPPSWADALSFEEFPMRTISDIDERDRILFIHIGHFLHWFAASEFGLANLLVRALGINDFDKYEILAAGLDVRTICHRLKLAAVAYLPLGPNLDKRLSYFEKTMIPVRNKFAHRVPILDSTGNLITFGTMANLQAVSQSGKLDPKHTITTKELFEKAEWLNWFAGELAVALGDSTHTENIEIIHPKTTLPPEANQPSSRKDREAKPRKPDRKPS